jgi:sugar phosphate isomerase/epimerase
LLLTLSLTELGNYGERVGSTLALEMGQETPADWAAYMQGFTSGGLGICLDPANLVGLRYDPAAAVTTLHQWLRYVYARDGVPGRPGSGVNEVPLGHGDVDWMALLGALTEVGHAGWLTIQRALTRDPLGEARGAISFLRRLVG